MRIRFFSWLAIGVAAAFLVVASTAFTLADIAAVSLGVGIGMLVATLFVAYRYRNDIPSLVTGTVAALVSAWAIVASQVYSFSTVQNLTLGEGLAISALALIGLTAHELSTERVVHSLSIQAGEREPEAARDPLAA
jgi:hypothetical protein